jgi:hypothetical protein
MRPAARLLTIFGGLVAGFMTSLAAVALHQSWAWLTCAAMVTVLVLLSVPAGGWLRLPFALGWLLVVLAAMLGRPEGDYVLEAEPHGYAVLFGGVVVLVGAAVTSTARGAEPTDVGTIP